MSLVVGEGSEASFQASWYTFDTKEVRLCFILGILYVCGCDLSSKGLLITQMLFAAYKTESTVSCCGMLDALGRLATIALPDAVHCWWGSNDKLAPEQIELALRSQRADTKIIWHTEESGHGGDALFGDGLEPGDSMANRIWQCLNLTVEGYLDAEVEQIACSLCAIAIQRLIGIVLESKHSGESRVQLDDGGNLTVSCLSGSRFLGERLIVDYETLVELEIFGCEDSYSLFSLLSNTCVSAPGRKLLKSWFQTPLTDGLILQDRLDSVEGLMHQEETMSNMRGLLKKVGDPVKLLENVVKMQTIKPQVKHFVKLQEGFEALLLLQAASVQLVTRGWQKDADENRKPPKILVRLVHSISDELIYGTLIIRNEAGNTTDTII
jgi:hypothetical protein